jgi:GNAT superfamily N-acetyltransferase
VIRTAEPSDLDRIIEIASQSLVDGPYAGIIKDVPAKARQCAEMVMASGKILLAAQDDGFVVGMIGIIFARHHFSDQPYATELLWYVLPAYRKGNNFGMELMWKAEQEARDWGAEDMVMTAPNDTVASIYKRMGYARLEETYRKSLNRGN